METSLGDGGHAGDMKAAVGKMFSRREVRGFPDDLVALDDLAGAVFVADHPLSAQQGYRPIGIVPDGDKIDKGMRPVGRQARPPAMVAEPIEAGRESG